MYRILLGLIVCLSFLNVKIFAQSSVSTSFKIEKNRLLWHDKIDREQARLLKLDGKDDSLITISRDSTINLQIEYALIKGVDDLQEKIETDSTLSNNNKIKYLLGLESLVKGYNSHYQRQDYPVTIAQALTDAFSRAMELEKKGESIEPVISENTYAVGKILVDCFCFKENKGVSAGNELLVRKYITLHSTTKDIITALMSNINVPFADSLIKVATYQNPNQVYDYASSRDRLGAKIRSNTDPLVQTVSRMATSRSGRLYFPFIDMILSGKISYEEIDKVKDNALSYYRLLVKTRIEYAGRMSGLQRDTPMGMPALTERISKNAKEEFIRAINGLHDSPDAVRFKIIEPLTAQELYYLCVLGEDEIYTSSYIGVFKRIFQRMKVPRGDTLIMSVNADYFRKFIKLAAAYNTLDTLLKSMPQENAVSLMRAFMIGLEKSTSPTNAEDAVDVADSYSSIFEKNKKLAMFMLDEAGWNLERCIKNGNKNGQVIYNLEKTLFESASDTSVNLTQQLGIEPVYSVDYNSLLDDSGRVVQQVFFYGDEDKDGQNSYANFLTLFRNKAEWSITDNNPDWIWIKSVKGKPVWIFANKPLYGPEDPDAKAQAKLRDYLFDRNIRPTIFIHRGHSYHVKYSLEQIQSSARIVVLGSCGGYNNLNEVLNISNDAHIISSKQVGTRTVNEPILQAINTSVRAGKSVEWIPMWRDLSKQFSGAQKEMFDDYIPPYKNLGAIFIKAYRKALGEE
ncbi:MAG: hypothetical protein ABIN89_14410 [Chitinophagaceae bacterium]